MLKMPGRMLAVSSWYVRQKLSNMFGDGRMTDSNL